jgi:DNA-directed RNA polymerase subunit H (RpoH/RPB5)
MLKKTKEKFQDDGYKIVVKENDLIGTTQDEKIIVRVATGEKSVGVAVIRNLLKVAEKEEVTETHLVSDASLTPQAKKMVAEHSIRYLSMKNVLIDIFQHSLVPKHTILTDEEKEDLFSKLKIGAHHLPKIKRTDPIIKLLNGKPGEVVKIQRDSPTAGVSIYYRLIIVG